MPARIAAHALRLAVAVVLVASAAFASDEQAELFAATFDAHWETLRDGYPYFELYGVDWEAERAEHRPRAVAAPDATEFAWELARLFACLPDAHLSYLPPIEDVLLRWSVPDIDTALVERRVLVTGWPEGDVPALPEAFADAPHGFPEIISVRGQPALGTAELLAGGPPGTLCDVRLRWPDGSETEHAFKRPDEPNLTPPRTHYGEGWLVVGRVGSVGYMRIRTFDPKLGTLGPDGKMTTMLRAALRELDDTSGLILDLQGNGGGLVAASDPFLGNLIERSLGYRWGNADGKRRVIRPRRPRYEGDVVCIVDERSASGGEWAARILRDAGRAIVIGGRTMGAEAAVLESEGPDGSVVNYSGWPMVEPGREPFQAVGIELDHALPLTVADVRALGLQPARDAVRRARFTKALELLGGEPGRVDELIELADSEDDAVVEE